jgi:hypothetical protein
MIVSSAVTVFGSCTSFCSAWTSDRNENRLQRRRLSKHLLAFFFLGINGFGRSRLLRRASVWATQARADGQSGKTWEGAVAGMLASLLLAARRITGFF